MGKKAAEDMGEPTAPPDARQDGRGADDSVGRSEGMRLDDDALRQIDDALKMFGDM